MQNYPNVKLNAYHIKIRDFACFRASVAKFFDFPLYYYSRVDVDEPLPRFVRRLL